jgi:putative colanic acid biosynthesis UDP-glucose lipid carrier transferase
MAIQSRGLYILRHALPVTDVLLVNLSYVSAYYLAGYLGKDVYIELNNNYIIVCNLLWLLSAAIFGFYRSFRIEGLEKIYLATLRSIVLHFILFIAYLWFAQDVNFSRSFLIIFYALLCLAFIINRFIGTYVQYIFLRRFHAGKKVGVLGSNQTAVLISNYLQSQRTFEFCGFIGDDADLDVGHDGVLPEGITQKMALAADKGIKEIYVAVAPHQFSELSALVEEADRLCIRLKFIPNIMPTLRTGSRINYMGHELQVISLRHEPLEDLSNRFKKRAFDLVFSSIVIVFVLSWLYPLLAIIIKIQSPGPVLFKQLRSGRNDKAFWCYKFRSMVVNSEADRQQARRDDQRITPIGKFMRRTSLDEFPQFFNVFLGNMSVVGPRPHMLNHTKQYREVVKQYMVRHFLKPGITGWAQIHGLRGETKNHEDMENRVKCDIYYLENWTAMLDVRIIFITLIKMMRGDTQAF